MTQHYGASAARSDSYGYDAIGRLISSNNENNISYDANGNVRSLRRLSATGTTIANLSMSYSGNRLASVTNIVPDDICIEDRGTFTYTYDSAGNLTSDGRNRLQIQNNVLNLPMRVNQSGTMGNGGTMTYMYLGDGTRAAARAGANATSYAGKRYRGTFVYDVTAGGVQSLESVAVSTGRLIALTGTNGAVSFESDGFITDHLGNVAVVVNLSASSSTSTNNAILEQNEYTPFGTKLNVSGLKTQAANRWRYAGKEEQDIAGMNLRLLDFGARYYDSFTCRWNAVDPLAHKYFPMSPYNYCGNDPVNRFDPDGRVSTPVFPYFIVNVPAAVESGALAASLTAVSTGATSALALVGTMFLCVSDTPIDQQASAETSLEEQPPILASKPYYPPSPGWVGGEGRKAGDKQGKAEASFNKALNDSGYGNNNNDFNPKNTPTPGSKILATLLGVGALLDTCEGAGYGPTSAASNRDPQAQKPNQKGNDTQISPAQQSDKGNQTEKSTNVFIRFINNLFTAQR